MASTRSPSPASGAASPEPLSPRAKINALLAGLDSSDDENGSGDKGARKPKTSLPRLPPAVDAASQPAADDSDDESDVEVRPRGRLAARMLGATPSAPQPRTSASPEDAADMADSEDNSDVPTGHRRLQRKTVGSSTPQKSGGVADKPRSPGLFVSSPLRPSPTKTADQPSDSEQDLPAVKSDRFKALVERKKQERLAREAAEEARKAERQEKLASELDMMVSDEGNPSDITDDEGGRRLTQADRPARKASKKAIEEMNRETQRMARSMQLAHEAKTRRKITKASLFERFNFRPAGELEPKTASSSRPGSPASDVEMRDSETPPSSPPAVDGAKKTTETTRAAVGDDEMPLSEQLTERTQLPSLDKGKGKEVVRESTDKPEIKPKRQVRVKLPALGANHVTLDSDDDELEITRTTKDKIDAIFDNLPAKRETQSHSLKALRTLAQVKSPGKERRRKDEHSGMTMGDLQLYLHQKAKQQAKLERERRMDMLKAQGVVVQTAEERERQMQEVEDIVAKAREEAQQLMQQERAAAKKNKGSDAENDPLAWDDSEDEDYEDGAKSGEEDGPALELSGSEDEEEGEEEQEDQGDADGVMFDEDAEDGDSEASDELAEPPQGDNANPDGSEEEEEEADLPAAARKRARKQVAVLSDDEDEVESTPKPKAASQATPNAPSSVTPKAPSSVLRSAKKTFIPGLAVDGPAGLGLTQIFAGTMDESQMSPSQGGPTQSMMPDFDNFPDSNFSATMGDDAVVDATMPATQNDETQATTQGVELNMEQTQMHGLDSLMRDVPNTQLSDIVEASQDAGFQEHTPLRERFVDATPHSTVETVVLAQEDAAHQDSPLVRRGRLRRKMDVPEPSGEPVATAATGKTTASQTAFGAMQDGAKKEKRRRDIEEFNRKKSKAKEMVEEHAEESEDEYQGLGGYDGEDSDDESIASVKDMIDDAAGNDADERKIAAFYADRERANDEKQVEQLFKDITNGMLRRKRGADYDLSDSDDGGEARKRMKRRQFAKMQKALFADERVKKMAENPGNQAFLRTIEDRASDDEMDFLDVVDEPSQEASQSEPQSQDERSGPTGEPRVQVVPDSQPRPALSSAHQNRPPAHQRRVKNGKKPANIGEVRETLSDLLEDERSGSVIPATEAGSDSEDEEVPPSPARSNKENRAPGSLRRSGSGSSGVVDRLSLRRNPSSGGGAAGSGSSSRLAFSAAHAGSSSSFKVPALLRRATTNSLMSTSSTDSAASSSSSAAAAASASGGFGDEAKVKRAASKRSGVNAFARESDARSRLQKSEMKREARKVKGAERRVGVVGGLLARGSFE